MRILVQTAMKVHENLAQFIAQYQGNLSAG